MLANPTLLNGGLSATEQKKLEQYSSEVAIEQELADFQTKRALIHQNWKSDAQFSVLGLIESLANETNIRVDLENMVIAPNEYLDDTHQTLLLMAVQQQVIPLVQCLLTLGASVAIPSDTSLDVVINPTTALEENPNTYFLKQKSRGVWRFVYVDENQNINLLKINEFPELVILLKEFDSSLIDLVNLEEKVRAILLPKHRLLYSTTPLLEAAKIIKEINLEGSLYSILIQQGLNEASPRSLELVSAYNLKKLSEEVFAQALKNLLVQYRNDRTQSFKTYPKFNEAKKSVLEWFGWDRSKDRAIEYAKFMCILIEAEKTHDYQIALALCEKVIQMSKTLIGSFLIEGATTITAKADKFIKERPEIYKAEIDNFRALQQKKTIKEDDYLLEKIRAEDHAAHQKTVMENKKENELLKVTIENNKISADEQIAQLQKQIEQLRNPHSEPMLIKKNSENNTYRNNSNYGNSQGIFGGGQSLGTIPQLSQTPQLTEINILLKENHWQSRDCSLENYNFFTALASEINRINSNLNESFVDEKKLRNDCHLCYIKNKKIVQSLNTALKNKNPKIFLSTRFTDYSLIIFNQLEAKQNDVVFIEGNGSVEGVLLCMKLGLEAIYFVKSDQDNNFIYSKATAKGYVTDIEESEVKENADHCPVLFINIKSYYPIAISEILLEEKTEDRLEDDAYLSEDDDEALGFSMDEIVWSFPKI